MCFHDVLFYMAETTKRQQEYRGTYQQLMSIAVPLQSALRY